MRGGVVNNQIKIGLLQSLKVKKIKIREYLAKLQARTWLSRALSSSFSIVLARRAKCETTTLFAKYSLIKKIHSQTQSTFFWPTLYSVSEC